MSFYVYNNYYVKGERRGNCIRIIRKQSNNLNYVNRNTVFAPLLSEYSDESETRMNDGLIDVWDGFEYFAFSNSISVSETNTVLSKSDDGFCVTLDVLQKSFLAPGIRSPAESK